MERNPTNKRPIKRNRGFARLSKERRKMIAQRGQARLRQLDKQHKFSTTEAKVARQGQIEGADQHGGH